MKVLVCFFSCYNKDLLTCTCFISHSLMKLIALCRRAQEYRGGERENEICSTSGSRESSDGS